MRYLPYSLTLISCLYCTVSISPSRVVITVQLCRSPTPLQAISSHLRHTHTLLETPVASLIAHLADTMLRCRAPPLEALRCPLRCPLRSLPHPYFPSRHIVGRVLSLLVVLSTTRDCLTC